MTVIKNILVFFFLINLFSSCTGFLERKPLDELTADSYFKTQGEMETYINNFYSMFTPYSKIIGEFADNAANFHPSNRVKGTRTVPATGGGWEWSKLRDINFLLANIKQFEGTDALEHQYEGVGRFFRALFYFRKVKMFGDVPWYSTIIKTNDSKLLHKSRDSRDKVMDSILLDINFAINNLNEEPSVAKVTKWTALALKSRICLYEGTYRKYHSLGNYKNLLEQCIDASSNLMKSGHYKIYTDNGDINNAYRQLFSSTNAISQEIILAKLYSSAVPLYHGIGFHTNSSSFGRPGVTKQVINSYLMADGSRFTDIPGHNKMQFYEETRNRDPRLAQTIRTPGFVQIGTSHPVVPDFTASLSGYQYIKFLQGPAHFNSNNDNDLPIFRYAEVLLNYAEANAENGTLTQGDLDQSIGLIRARVGLPNINMTNANANPDPFMEKQYKNVSGINKGVILEIRRERRIELIREGFRWDDLMRWKDGPAVAKTFKGMYFPGLGKYDLDHNGTIDLVIFQGSKPTNTISGAQYRSLQQMHLEHGANGGLMVLNADVIKKWESPKDYLYPIPLQDLQLNTNLSQNPGWPSH